MSRTLIGLLLMTLLAACGSGDGDAGATTADSEPAAAPETSATEPADEPTETTEAETPETTSPEPASPESTESGSADGATASVATVSIAGETYEFRTTGFPAETCDPDFFGGVQVVLAPADDNGEPLAFEGVISPLTIVLLPPDLADDAPSVEFREPGGPTEWIANADSAAGSQVGEWAVEDGRVTGMATFVSDAGDGPVDGTFEVVCAEE